MTGKEVQKWADDFMFTSEKHTDVREGPKVHLLQMNHDPLGSVAATAKMYKGEVVRDLSEVTDEERLHYLGEIQRTKLKMPLEAISMHFMFENVTRAFTHQLVRIRTAAYAQESMRFAVVEDMTEAVALPPSLAAFNDPAVSAAAWEAFDQGYHLTKQQRHFLTWERAVARIGEAYMELVNDGMPAEDARGLMPTNIVTRIHDIINYRNLLEHSGNRLCTQAQFEWRLVFSGIAKAIREYGENKTYKATSPNGGVVRRNSLWQFEELSRLFRPACYFAGHCPFEAEFDRKCSIRGRVQANAAIGRPSTEWHEVGYGHYDGSGHPEILPIRPEEWLADPAAAR